MKTVTLQVATLEEVKRRAQDAFKGKKQGARISFTTPELLFRLMTAKRWELIRSMVGAGPLTIREVARRVDRDVKAVHGDVHALLDAGILHKTGRGLIVFPFDAIRVDVMRARPDSDAVPWRRQLFQRPRRTHSAPHLSFLLGRLGGLAAGCFCGNRRI